MVEGKVHKRLSKVHYKYWTYEKWEEDLDNKGADCVAGHNSKHDEGAEALDEDGRHVKDAEDGGLEGAEEEIEFF